MKLEAKYLRIGNLVECNGSIKEVYNIYSNGWDFLYEDTDCRFVEHEHTKPIPLTEEWLLKMGFEKELDGFYRKNKSGIIEFCFYDNGILATTQSVCLSHFKTYTTH